MKTCLEMKCREVKSRTPKFQQRCMSSISVIDFQKFSVTSHFRQALDLCFSFENNLIVAVCLTSLKFKDLLALDTTVELGGIAAKSLEWAK